MTSAVGRASASQLVLAVDLGGTKIETALVDSRGAVLQESRLRAPTGAGTSPSSLEAAIALCVRGTLAHLPPDAEFLGAGIASAGPIDHRSGTVSPVNMTSLGGAYPLVEAVRSVLDGMPDTVLLGHDGGCLAIAESWLGSTKDARTSLSFVVSTGIGGGVVNDGTLFGGATGNAGHLGQMVVGELTLEEIASGPSSTDWARVHGWTGETGEDLARSAAMRDATARAAIERSASAIGAALASVAVLIDLDHVAVGGGFSRVSTDYVELVAAAYRERVRLPHLVGIPITRSSLGPDGPLQGAAALVLFEKSHMRRAADERIEG